MARNVSGPASQDGLGRHPEGNLAILGLGANLGLAQDTLLWAIRALEKALDGIRIAPLYRSPAVSPWPQPDFLNTVVSGGTRLAPHALLAVGKRLEWLAGRRPGVRFGPRPLDVDLLLYQGYSSTRPELTVPHPRLLERAFVLAPLADLHPDLQIPGTGQTAAGALHALGSEQETSRVPWRSLPGC
jgi:2-amino-4-hydroxy-6-hydroxymethyldihydropteridine diphosphokinase